MGEIDYSRIGHRYNEQLQAERALQLRSLSLLLKYIYDSATHQETIDCSLTKDVAAGYVCTINNLNSATIKTFNMFADRRQFSWSWFPKVPGLKQYHWKPGSLTQQEIASNLFKGFTADCLVINDSDEEFEQNQKISNDLYREKCDSPILLQFKAIPALASPYGNNSFGKATLSSLVQVSMQVAR